MHSEYNESASEQEGQVQTTSDLDLMNAFLNEKIEEPPNEVITKRFTRVKDVDKIEGIRALSHISIPSAPYSLLFEI